MNRFPNGARVCFIGDSITHNNLFLAHIVAYYREHFADARVEFYNCGISGGRLTTTLNCFDEDILPYNPTHAVIMIGINDSDRNALIGAKEHKYYSLERAYNNYKTNLEMLCKRLEGIGTKIILCTQTPYDEYLESDDQVLHGGSALMLGYAEFIKSFAKEKGYHVCDYHSYITRIIQTETIYNPDRVHPNDRGQYYMAKCFLEFQGLDIGEEKALPEDVAKWHEVVGKLRNTIATEHFILNDDFTTTQQERWDAIKDYLENEQTGEYVEYFKFLAREYQTDKQKQQENIQFTIDFMKKQ